MKSLGILLIVSSGIWLAIKIYFSYTRRISVLKQLLSDAQIIKNEIILKRETFLNALSRLERNHISGRFYDNLSGVLSEGKTVFEAFKESSFILSDYLKMEDLRELEDFGRLVGETDVEGQIRAFDVFLSGMERNLKFAEEGKKSKMKAECGAVILGFAIAGLVMV